MKSLMMVLALVGVAAFAADPVTPKHDEVMPLTIQLAKDGADYPVVVKDGADTFAVYIVKGGKPYFANKKGDSVFVEGKDKSYTLYYVDQKAEQIKEVPKEDPKLLSDADRATVRRLGEIVADDKMTPVCYCCGGGGYNYPAYYTYGDYYGGYNNGYYGGNSYWGGGVYRPYWRARYWGFRARWAYRRWRW